MSFDVEKIFEDCAMIYECATTRQELVEETTHHPVTAASVAADMVREGYSIIDAAIQLYQDDWYAFDIFGVRFAHFYQMVCYLVK